MITRRITIWNKPESFTIPTLNQEIQNIIDRTNAKYQSLDDNYLKGVVDGSDAAAGFIGEFISSSVAVASAVSSTGSTQWVDVTHIDLTAGDWDIQGIVGFNLNGSTTTVAQGAISTTAGNSATGQTTGDNRFMTLPPTAATDTSVSLRVRASITGNTTYYLKFSFTHGAGTPKAYGKIVARRIR